MYRFKIVASLVSDLPFLLRFGKTLRAEACAFFELITSVAGNGGNATEPKKPSGITPQSNLRFR
jgi:hypothetical protein